MAEQIMLSVLMFFVAFLFTGLIALFFKTKAHDFVQRLLGWIYLVWAIATFVNEKAAYLKFAYWPGGGALEPWFVVDYLLTMFFIAWLLLLWHLLAFSKTKN